MADLEVQTRNNDGALCFFGTMQEAINHAEENSDVWKISFSLPNGERVRLVKEQEYADPFWVYEPPMGEVKEQLNKES